MKPTMILGIETSCDETAVALVDNTKHIRAHALASQQQTHAPYGGVVPEVAARAHLEVLKDLTHQALHHAKADWPDITAIAATCGPGLIGGVMVGAMFGKAMAAAQHKPFIAINHLAAHALSPRLVADIAFPYLLLLVSGGHTQLVVVRGANHFSCLGTTRDDAAGECFDKSAKLLGLPYPGGPQLEKLADAGDATRFALPRPMVGQAGADFSFAGLKTAVRLVIEGKNFGAEDAPHLAASVQETIAHVLAERTENALSMAGKVEALVVAGGVAANGAVRQRLQAVAEKNRLPFVAPPLWLCTDNGAMIAHAGLERLAENPTINDQSIACRPRWPLEEMGG